MQQASLPSDARGFPGGSKIPPGGPKVATGSPKAAPKTALLGNAGTELSRMPLLDEIMGRIAVQGAERIEKLAEFRLKGEVLGMKIEKLGVALGTLGETFVTALLDAPEWTSKVLFCLNGELIQLLIDIICGGDGSEAPTQAHRAPTSVDLGFAQLFCEQMATVTTEAFAEVLPSPIGFGAILKKLDVGLLGKPGHSALLVDLGFESLGQRGTLRMILPQAALDRLRPKLGRLPQEDRGPGDPEWAQRLETEIGRTSIALDAMIEGEVLTLADIAGLQVGQVIGLVGAPRGRVKLLADNQTYFRGELGQDDGKYTVRIDEVTNLDAMAGK